MKYYLHDSNAFEDEKITELYINFGYEGLGLFYTLLEKLALQEKPVKTLVLKQQLKVGKRLEKCWKFMESLGIISSNNGETFNKQLLNFSEKYQIKKEKNAKRISEWREKQEHAENVTRYEQVRNTPKVKESKVKESKVNNIIVLPYQSEQFIKTWEILIQEKKWKSKSENALQMSLIKLSKYPEQDAIKMMQDCIAGGWQGIVEPKNNNYGNTGNGNGRNPNSRISDTFRQRNKEDLLNAINKIAASDPE